MENKNKELELFYKYKAGDQNAKKELIHSLTPLITSHVQKYNSSGLPVSAIKLEGQNLASQAIDTYDPNKSQLNTHVYNNLQKLSRFVSTYQNVGHIPEPRVLMLGTYNTVSSNLEFELGRKPTVNEIADAMHINPIEVERLQTELRGDLSTGIKNTESDTIGGFYEYVAKQDYDPNVIDAAYALYLDYSKTDPINKTILESTFNINGAPIKTNKEIAMQYNVHENDIRERKVKLFKEIKAIL